MINRIFFWSSCFLLLISCKSFNNSKITNVSKIDSTIVSVDSVVILSEQYKVMYKTDEILYIINKTGDTIQKIPDLPSDFEFVDFNEDHLMDIRINYMGNVPVQDLLLFDGTRKQFRLVNGFSDYPEAKKIKGTDFYFSYHRSGCADMNWDSDLFTIKNFYTFCLGKISGIGCDDGDESKAIHIYAIKDTIKSLIKSFPIDTINSFKDNKWGFIDDYWNRNYTKFIY